MTKHLHLQLFFLLFFLCSLSGSLLGQEVVTISPTTSTSTDGSVTVISDSGKSVYVSLNEGPRFEISKHNSGHVFSNLGQGDYLLRYYWWDDVRGLYSTKTVILVGGMSNYCNSYGSEWWGARITSVVFNELESNIVTPIIASIGESYTLSVTVDPGYEAYVCAWIDWDQSGVFDNYEFIALGSVIGITDLNINIEIPDVAKEGNTRMRISARENQYPTSCETDFDGEVEDYTLNVVSLDPGSDPCRRATSSVSIWDEDFQSNTVKGTSTSNRIKRQEYPQNKSDGWGLVGSNIDRDGEWNSDEINISNYSDLKCSIDIGSWGNKMEDSDYLKIYYAVDRGTYEEFSVNGIHKNDISAQTACANIPEGDKLTIKVGMKNSATDEYYYIDNVVVSGIPIAQVTPPPVITAERNPNPRFCPGSDPVKVVTAILINTNGASLTEMSVQISGNYVKGEDLLELSSPVAGITDNWDVDAGKLTLRGSVTVNLFETAIKKVQYKNTNLTPTLNVRTFSITFLQANYLPSSGHFYEFVSDVGIRWDDARDAAAAATSTYYGLQGYLATLTSQEESDLAGSQITGAGWIGASDEDTEGVWKWVTGPEAGTVFWNGDENGNSPNWAFWNDNEPNNKGNEDYAHINARNVGVIGGWNDLTITGLSSGDFQPKGYIIEYGGFTTDPKLSISASTAIMVGDTERPIISGMPADIIINNCNQVVNWPEPSASDKCGAVTLTKDYDPGEVFPFGETVVTYTATNGAGSVTASFKVTVQDGGQAPLLCFEAENYAFEGSVSQSSLYGGGIASLAVDGNTDGVYNNKSVTHTNKEDAQDWWQVDLGAQENVDYVNIYRRTDCCTWRLENFYVLLSDNDLQSVSLTDALHDPTVESYYVAGDPGDLKRILTSGNTFRYVKIQLKDTDYLSLAEVEVMGCTSQTKDDITIPAESGKCSAQATWDRPSAIDNCGTVTLSSDHNSGDDFPVGTTKVTYTATDGTNEVKSSFNVIVTDNELPTITAPGALTVYIDSGSCDAADVDLGTPVTADNCSVAKIDNNAPAIFPLGETTVTWTVIDGAGLQATATQMVTVEDNVPPIAISQNITVQLDATCNATILASDVDNGSSDNCGLISMSLSQTTFRCSNIGENNVTLTVKDAHGNTTNCDAVVTVEDKTDPTITCPADVSAFADAGLCTASSVALGTPIVVDNCSFVKGQGLETVNLGMAGEFAILTKTGVTSVYKSHITGDVGSSPIEGSKMTFLYDEVTTGGTVYSVDATGSADFVTDAPRLDKAVADMAAAYTDAAGRDHPDFTNLGAGGIGGKTLTPGLYNFTSAVTATKDMIIAGGPNDIWIFQIAGTFNTAKGVKIILTGGAQAKNIFWQIAGAVTLGVESHFEGIILGATNIALQTGASINGRLLAQTAVTLQQNTVKNPVALETTAADKCTVLSVTNDAPEVFQIGTTTVTWTVTDALENAATCEQIVTVSDNEAPTIKAPGALTVSTDSGSCDAASADVDLGTPVTADNCSVATVDNDAPAIFPLGDTKVTWTVIDGAGLQATATQMVTVEDNVPPIAISQDITVQLDAACNATIAAIDIDKGSSDNCGITSMSLSQTTFTCNNIGVNDVTLTVTDAHGNTGDCVALVTVEDSIEPTITCLDDVSVAVDEGLCTASSVALGTPIVVDNCSLVKDQGLETVDLGVAGEFVILAKTAITSVPTSQIFGDVGTGPITGAAMTFARSEVVSGTVYSVDATGPALVVTDADRLTTAVGDMEAAYADAAGRTSTDLKNLGAKITGGETLTPGLYKSIAAITVATNITITGGPNDIWIFQIAGAFTMAADVKIKLTGGAQAKNIFWQITNAITLGAGSHFEGIILGKTSATLQTGASINGRVLAQTAVTLQQNTVTNPDALETTVEDNCSVVSVTNDAPEVFPIGTTEVTWTVADGAGNTATCTQNVRVTDDSKPILTDCPTDITVGACNNTVDWTAPTVTDNCSFTLSSNYNSGDDFPVGTTTTVIYTATDKADNTATCSFDVIVLPEIEASITVDNSPICEGETVKITALIGGVEAPYSFEFYLNNTAIGIDASYTIVGDELTSSLFNNNDKIKIKVRDDNACEKISSEIIIKVSPKPHPIGIFF
ncbi:MAG: ice-binding family protein [Labilibaculum antarcticum]